MRDALREARERLRGRLDVRVLEPSPPAVEEGPFLADDPVAGGEVVPVERPAARSWAELCEMEDDPELVAWCRDRWLVRSPLAPLPAGFGPTRASLHAVAEHLVAPCRHAATGKIGLRFTYHGFGTPFLPGGRQVRVEDGVLVDGERAYPLSTLRAAGTFLDLIPGAPVGVYTASTPLDLDRPLEVETAAARALGDWFGFCASVLEQLRSEAGADDSPSRVQLWPEHFDPAIEMGAEGHRANYGGSPGDDDHPEPYLYVGPWGPRSGAFWNETFGASLSYQAMLSGADALEFLRLGKELMAQ